MRDLTRRLTMTLLHVTLVVIGLTSFVQSQDAECTLECPIDAPCTLGSATYTHQNIIQLENHFDGMHCACPSGWTGVLCDHRYESCTDSHDCFHGGQCIEGIQDSLGNDQLVCDCSTAIAADGTQYVGKYCETPFEKSCHHIAANSNLGDSNEDLFCVNGGDCNPNYALDGLPCLCDDGWEGFHCEFKSGEVPECDLDCKNDGVCIVGILSPEETEFLHRIWTDAEIHDHMRCICPTGYGGPTCEVVSETCGVDGNTACYHGGSCVTTTTTQNGVSITDYHCDCTTASDSQGNKYAGLYCETPSTVFCDVDDDSLFCTNGGTCKENPIEGCDCIDGFEGTKCEYNMEFITEDVDQGNPVETEAEFCAGIYCMNGARCSTQDFVTEDGTTGTHQVCDCALASLDSQSQGGITMFAGNACQYSSTAICATADNGEIMFCVNGGECQIDGSCSCPTGWSGEHCEEMAKQDTTTGNPTCGDTVCYNGGQCVETKVIVDQEGMVSTQYYCDCTQATDSEHLYAGISCEYKSTTLCTFPENEGDSLEGMLFCTNQGTCQTNIHKGCNCPSGFSGFSCEYLNIDEHPTLQDDNTIAEIQNTQECGDLTCKNGGICTSTLIPNSETGELTEVSYCDCSTTATDSTVYAGVECENPATTFCTVPEEGAGLETTVFCVQGGECKSNVFQGCDCQDGWTGVHCEYAMDTEDLLGDDDGTPDGVTECGDTICFNGGLCEILDEVDSQGQPQSTYACDCSSTATSFEIYGGPTCSFKSTSICEAVGSGESLVASSVCFNHGTCSDDSGTSCECPSGFSGDQCEFQVVDDSHSHLGESCGDGYCYNGGACVTTRIISQDGDDTVEYRCDCSSAMVGLDLYAGESCQYKSTTFCTHTTGDSLQGLLFCVNGGECKDNPQEGCDCPPGWSGFFCEFETAVEDITGDDDLDSRERCGNYVCLNGGFCVSTLVEDSNGAMSTLQHCDCSQAFDGTDLYSGPNCEYQATTYCTESENDSTGVMFCTNGGTCNSENVLEGCDCPIHWTGMHCQLPADNDDDDVDDDAPSVLCGDQECLNGGQCIDFVANGLIEHNCDCSTAFDNVHLYDGPYCQYKSTELCSTPSGNSLEGVEFCVNNGACRDDGTCHCPSGYAGTRCELPLYEGLDSEDEAEGKDENEFDTECHLTCFNGGHCTEGAKDHGDLLNTIGSVSHLNRTYDETYFEHCACPDGFVGLTCEHTVEVCGENEHYCLHGSTCVNDNGEHLCDCNQANATIGHGDQSTVFAGASCEHPATDICIHHSTTVARPMFFCVNQGSCNAYVSEGEPDPGCTCPDNWTGPHCEIRLEVVGVTSGSKEAGDVVLIATVTILILVPVLLCITCCIRKGRRSNLDLSERFMFFRRRRRRGQGLSGDDPRTQSSNLAPKRLSSYPGAPKHISSASDPISAGIRLDPDDEPPEPYQDEPTEHFYRDKGAYEYSDSGSHSTTGEGYRDDPILVNVGPPKDDDGNPLHNVDFI